MKNIVLICFGLLATFMGSAQTLPLGFEEKAVTLETSSGKIYGSIVAPKTATPVPIVLIIAGSGPTDRNGDNPAAMSSSYKKLAYALANQNIATLRYDKRGIAESAPAMKSESDIRFDQYIEDAADWVYLLKKNKQFSEVTVLGHSEGSLIGMIAANNTKANKFISVAGIGQTADKILKEQLGQQAKEIQDLCFPLIDSLAAGHMVNNANPMLASLFRKSVQPYMISWFKYNPQVEIGKMKMPVLIIQGTNDIQVSEKDAKMLLAGDPKAKLVMINKMNHILRIVEGDQAANLASYNNATLPLADELIQSVTDFVRNK